MTLLDKNFFVRTGSIAVLIPVVLGILYRGAPFSQLVMVGVTVIMLYEFMGMTQTLRLKRVWQVGGFIYITTPFAYLIYLTIIHPKPFEATLALFGFIWSIDVGAYLTGRLVGGPLLAPRISPKKTWSGFVGGTVIGTAIFMVLCHYLHVFEHVTLPLILVLACAAQGGDLLESWVKRLAGVKDSGNIIPGHGGFLDRLDGFLAMLWVLFGAQFFFVI